MRRRLLVGALFVLGLGGLIWFSAGFIAEKYIQFFTGRIFENELVGPAKVIICIEKTAALEIARVYNPENEKPALVVLAQKAKEQICGQVILGAFIVKERVAGFKQMNVIRIESPEKAPADAPTVFLITTAQWAPEWQDIRFWIKKWNAIWN